MTNSKELVVLSSFLYKNRYYFCHETSESSKQKFKRKVKKKCLVKTVTDFWIVLLYKNNENFQI